MAKSAGVSQSMVSYVFNDNSKISVPPETRQRIWTAIKELGYVANSAAQSLRTRKTYTIAGIIPDITNPFYPAFEKGIQDKAEARGYDLIMYNTGGTQEKEQKCLHSLQQGRVDGVIAVLFHLRTNDLRVLLEREIAVVRLEAMKREAGKLDLPLDNLYVDNVAATRTAVDYLIGRGHSRIGFIVGKSGPWKARDLGYRQALVEHGIVVDETLILEGDFQENSGYYCMWELLQLSSRPTAVFAANDMMAMGALAAIKEAGLEVPRDVAIVGFDDIPTAKLVTPALTTITQFQESLGRRATEMLFERLDGTTPGHGRFEEMPYELVVRESA